MTMRIGPIELENPQIQTPNRQKVSDYFKPTVNKDNIVYAPVGQVPTSYSVKLAVPTHVYKQIEGISEWTAPYPIALDELSQDMLGISGWGFIGNVKVEDNQNPETVIMSCDVAIIEEDENAYLKMDYATGKESGSTIPMTYPDVINESLFSDEFTTFDTTIETGLWEAPISGGLTGASISASGGKLNLTGTASVNKSAGIIFTATQDSIKPPFTMDFDMEWLRYATSYKHYIEIALYPDKPTSLYERGNNQWLGTLLDVAPTTAGLTVRKVKNAQYTNLTTRDVLSSSEKNPKLRYVVDNRGYMAVYFDTTGSGTYNKVWGSANPGWDITEGLYVVITFWNYKNTSETCKTSSINVYDNIKTSPNNEVAVPVGCTKITPAISSGNYVYRESEEGGMYLYHNPSSEIIFQTTFSDVDKGSVKVYNNNNESSTYRRVFNEENVFTKTSWYATNGLVKLFTDSNNKINFQCWNGSAYVTLNQFDIGTINYIKPYFVSPEYSIIQINRTYWHLFRGKQHVMVKHPYNNINFTRKTCYYHDDGNGYETTVVSSDNMPISMTGSFFCNIWDKGTGDCTTPIPADNYRLQIIQTNPTTIYSDYIPAADVTGIGWFDITDAPDHPEWGNGYIFNAREFFNVVDTKIIK